MDVDSFFSSLNMNEASSKQPEWEYDAMASLDFCNGDGWGYDDSVNYIKGDGIGNSFEYGNDRGGGWGSGYGYSDGGGWGHGY